MPWRGYVCAIASWQKGIVCSLSIQISSIESLAITSLSLLGFPNVIPLRSGGVFRVFLTQKSEVFGQIPCTMTPHTAHNSCP